MDGRLGDFAFEREEFQQLGWRSVNIEEDAMALRPRADLPLFLA